MILFRAISQQQYEDLSNGRPIAARDPSANIPMRQHIRRTMKNSQWISTTKEFFTLFKSGKNISKQSAIIRIDTDLAGDKIQIFDLSTDELQEQNGLFGKQEKNFAKGSREVLILGEIPAEACTIIVDYGSRQHVFVYKPQKDWKELFSKYIDNPGKPKENINILRTRINRFGIRAKGPMSRYKMHSILELVYILEHYASENCRYQWFSVLI